MVRGAPAGAADLRIWALTSALALGAGFMAEQIGEARWRGCATGMGTARRCDDGDSSSSGLGGVGRGTRRRELL